LSTLAENVKELKEGEPVALPPSEEWRAHVERISTPGRIAEVTEEDYFYWLEVLPLKCQRGSLFCFAEGADHFRVFWQDGEERFFCRQLTEEETARFCEVGQIPLPS
jgi:hypothetical protein